jgi:UDP-N-acetylmuramate--alanine ligase
LGETYHNRRSQTLTQVKDPARYLFCGIGGSGMLPLAMLMRRGGAEVVGSDRSFDQGKAKDKQAFLKGEGVALFPQDGSGLSDAGQILVTSTAVESQIPDVLKANQIGARKMHRADLLSNLFNAAANPIAIAGTSGKSTTTAMLGWILYAAGQAPTVVNGAVMANFRKESSEFASFVYGTGPAFVAEVDESDGSIKHYRPEIAILSNITIDHKTIDELKVLFSDYLGHAQKVVANLDCKAVTEVIATISGKPVLTYSIGNTNADVTALKDKQGVWTIVGKDGVSDTLNLQVFGDYNVSNALAAITAARVLGVSRKDACAFLAQFVGVARRMEPKGQPHGIHVYDDFAHNPDKIAASLSALRGKYNRILCLFQPHGYNPMEKMKDHFVEAFKSGFRPQDRLWMTEPVYYGGSVNRTPIVSEILALIGAPVAAHLSDRALFGEVVAQIAKQGDCVVIMGARDDTLTELAVGVVETLQAASS